MTKLNDVIGQASRGEPVFVSTLIAAIFGTFGAEVTDGTAQNIISAVAVIAAGLMARRYTTPQANPAPATKTVHLEQGDGTPITQEVPAVKPVITFAGKRPV